jgi:hypothetical protein
MKKIFILFFCLVVCGLVVAPASGYQWTLTDHSESVWESTWEAKYTGGVSGSVGTIEITEEFYPTIRFYETKGTYNFWVVTPKEDFDYLALTIASTSGFKYTPYHAFRIIDSYGSSGTVYAAGGTPPVGSRYEFIKKSGSWDTYLNGVYVSSVSSPISPERWCIFFYDYRYGYPYQPCSISLRDIIVTTSESQAWLLSRPPTGPNGTSHFLMYSEGAYTPGLYSGINTFVSSDFYLSWARPSIGYKGDLRYAERIDFVHFQTGEVVYSHYLNENDTHGRISFEVEDVFVNTSAPYGEYWIKLMRSDDMFMQGRFITYSQTPIGGHTILWDKIRYYSTDTAKITSSIASLDPAYEYSGKIFDIYGANHGTWSIPTTSHTETITINNWDTGIYYAAISLKEKSTGEEFDVAFTPMEIHEGVGFAGTTLDVVSGDPASNTSVTLTQAGTPQNTESDSDGKYVVGDLVQNYPVTFTANKTGYVHYDWIYTPLQARSYDFDMYLYPDPLFPAPPTPTWVDNNGTAVAGFVHKAHNKQPLESALVELTIDNVTSSTYTYGTGFYSFDNLSPDLNYSLNVYSAGYTNASASGTLGNGTVSTHNFQLNGMSSLYGRVHNANTYQAIADATVTATIGGSSYNTTSSSTGYYIIHDVPANTGYSVQATKTGFKPSDAKTGTLSDGSPTLQKIPMEGQYTLTLHFLDAKDRTIVGGDFTVYLDTGAETTASGGKAYFYNLVAGTYFVQTASSDSHYGSNTMVVVEGDTDKTVYLQRITQAGDAPAYGSQYPPHQVKFEIRTFAGAAVSNATIMAKGGEVSFGAVGWLQGLFGLKVDETPIHNETMIATTDSYGIANFLMIPVIKYDINVTKDGEELKQFTVYPKDDYYLILVGDTLWRDPSKDPLAVVTTSVSLKDKDGVISVNYLDINDDTSSVVMNVYQRSSANKTEKVLVDSHTVSASSNFTYNFTMADFARQSYYVEIDAAHGTLGDIERVYGVTFGGVRVPIGDIPSEMYIWIALGILMLSGCIFGATSAVAGAVIVCFFGWILLAFGWLDDLGLGAPLALSAASLIAVVSVLQKRFREEGFN